MQEKDSTRRTPYELFSGPVSTKPRGKELFDGKPPAEDRGKEDEKSMAGYSPASEKPAASSKGHFFWVLLLLVVNSFMIGGILCYLLVRMDSGGIEAAPAEAAAARPTQPVEPAEAHKPVRAELPKTRSQSIDPAELFENVQLSNATIQALEGSLSLRSAEALYKAQDYFKACYVYDRLRDNLVTNDLADACLDDYLVLKMALCLQKTQEQELMLSLFGQALESRSPVVQALTYYNLSFLQMHNQQFLHARTSAYRALALMSSFDETMPGTVESDCYFLAAEALTRYILKIQNNPKELPGRLWSNTIPVAEVPLEDQNSLKAFLRQGIEEINTGAVSPKITYHPQREAGAQWSAICIKAPMEEVLWKYGSTTNLNLNWDKSDSLLRNRPVTLYLPMTAGTYLAEVTAGSAGLLWRYDGEAASLYDPEAYTDFTLHRQALVAETTAIWQRFLLRYRGDHRTPNAHYALGILYTIGGQEPTALGEFKIINSQYPHNPLAPYSLLYSSKLRTNLKDFEGARTDLNDLLMQYPDSGIVDEASLYLAEATQESGLYEESRRMFEKVYRMNFNPETRCRAAYGLGQCAYEEGDYPKAQEWLSQAIDMMESPNDVRLGMAYTLLGRVCAKQKNYEMASRAFRAAMEERLSEDEYFEVTVDLIRSKISQQQYVEAVEILDSIPESHLNQEQTCEVMLIHSRILRDLDLAESAVSLLRRRIQFIADAGIRAQLSVELARCYLETGDLAVAERELTDSVYDLEGIAQTQEAMYLLAKVIYQRGRLEMAEEICRQILAQKELDGQVRRDVFILLGRLYQDQQRPEQAALAYAGISPKEEAGQP